MEFFLSIHHDRAIPRHGFLERFSRDKQKPYTIFAGLGLMSTEFDWAKRLLRFARSQVGRWTDWARRQLRVVQALIGLVGVIFLGALAVGMCYLNL